MTCWDPEVLWQETGKDTDAPWASRYGDGARTQRSVGLGRLLWCRIVASVAGKGRYSPTEVTSRVGIAGTLAKAEGTRVLEGGRWMW